MVVTGDSVTDNGNVTVTQRYKQSTLVDYDHVKS